VTSLSHDWFYSFNRTVALDINKTIVEEDTLKDENATIALTPAAQSLFEQLENEPLTRIVLYTFGQDWPTVSDQIQKQFPDITFPEENRYFIGREKEGPNVYKTQLGTTGVVNGLDFTVHDPVWNGKHEAMGPEEFQQWLDSIPGNIILRATYLPAEITSMSADTESTVGIGGRKDTNGKNTKGKIIASSLPILAFDDNPIDWEFFQNGEATGQECILAMAPKHYRGDDLGKKLEKALIDNKDEELIKKLRRKLKQSMDDQDVVKERVKQLGSVAAAQDYIDNLFNIELEALTENAN